MKRRQFLSRLLTAVAIAPVAACYVGDDTTKPPPGPSGGAADAAAAPTEFSVTNQDSSGHSHSFTIKCSHATADGWTYTAGGGHTHSVTLDQSQLQAIFAGETITVETTDGHPHTWVITRPEGMCS